MRRRRRATLRRMSRSRPLAVAATLLGVVLLVVAAVYVAEPAHALPGFFPGHVSSGAEYAHHHVKHGIAAAAVGLAALAYAWMSTGPRSRAADAVAR